MSVFSERLVEARIKKGLTQKAMAELLGITPTRLNYWEKGKREPDVLMIKKISKLLDVDPNYLLNISINAEKESDHQLLKKYNSLDQHGKEVVDSIIDIETRRLQTEKKSREEFSSELHEIIKCPIQEYEEKVCAGTGNYLDYTTAFITYLDYKPPRGTDFIVSVQGDSMEPTISDGDRLFIKKAKKLDYGDIGIFYIPPDGLVVKEYTREGLKAHNQKYPLVPGNVQIEIIGKVLGIVK